MLQWPTCAPVCAPRAIYNPACTLHRWPAAGDVIGLTNPGAFAIGDTLVGNGSPVVAFPPIPTFSPELFAYLRCPPNQRKPFIKGVEGERVGLPAHATKGKLLWHRE